MKESEILKKLDYVVGDPLVLREIEMEKPFCPFAEETLQFLDSWSLHCRRIQREEMEKGAQVYPDVAAFAFWCRRNAAEREKERYGEEIFERIGAGLTLHFASSNVPVLFAFSTAAALLAGNCVVLRLPLKKTPQEKILCRALRETFTEFPRWSRRILFFRSEHDPEINAFLTGISQVRIIWGGDEAVREIREAPLAVCGREISFGDRRSAAVLGADRILAMTNKELEAEALGFFNDTYLNDQNACSSPVLLYWLGSSVRIAAARKRFWEAVSEYAQKNYRMTGKLAVKKLEQACWIAARAEDVKVEFHKNTALCVWMPSLPEDCLALSVPGGFFLESGGETLDGLYPALTRKCQTITCLGVDPEEVRERILRQRVPGVDRVVPSGHALDFSLVWDGRDLIREMSRRVACF